MTCRVSYDPNYDPDTLYPLTKLLCLLYDEVCMWYPVQRLFEAHGDVNELLDLTEMGIITPVGESGWWDKKRRRRWPDFAGEWTQLDDHLVRMGRYIPFHTLVGREEEEFRQSVEDAARHDAEDLCFRELVYEAGALPYKHVLRSRDLPFWFACCFRAHRSIAAALGSYELVAENHQAVWEFLFQKMASDELARVEQEQPGVAKLLGNRQQVTAIAAFLEGLDLYLPQELSVEEIRRFREQGASIAFRQFLASAHRAIQERRSLALDRALMTEFGRLSRSYAARRQVVAFSLATLLTGPVLWLTTAISPALSAVAGAAIGGMWGQLTKAIEDVYDRAIGRHLTRYTWVLHLRKAMIHPHQR